MRKFEGMKKVLSAVLALSMVLSYAPVTAFAVTEDGSCEHHTHDESCGYVAAVEGADCGHECSDACKTKAVTGCTHNHEAEGCTYTPAAEAVACDYVHGEGCNHVYAQDVVLCTCGAEPQHTAECASVLTEGAECNCTPTVTHAEGCNPQAAVAESCDHVHGECAYKEAVEESWSCGHVCSVENGCITFVCAHVCPEDNCGFVAAVEGSECTFVCEECSAEPETEPTVLTITGWNWVDEYEILSEDGTYITLPNAADWETLKSILPTITATVDGAEVTVPVEWECENFPAEGAAQGTFQLKAILPEGYALGEGVAALELEVDLGVADDLDTIASGTCGTNVNWTLDDNGLLTITGTGKMTSSPWMDSYKSKIKEVVIENGVTSIGTSAFRECGNLTTITVKGDLTEVGGSAFQNCSRLTSATFLGNVGTVGYMAFNSSTKTLDLTINGNATSFDTNVFDLNYTTVTITYKGTNNPSAPSSGQFYEGSKYLNYFKIYVTPAYYAQSSSFCNRGVERPELNITVTSGGNGTAVAQYNGNPVTSLGMKRVATLVATPDEGYYLKEYQVVSGGVTIDEKKQFTVGQDNIEIKAIFEAIPEDFCTVSFDANGGTGNMDMIAVKGGKTGTLPQNLFKMSYYSFKEWNTAVDGSGTSYADKAQISITENTTLYAQWEKITYSVTYDANGGTGIMATETVEASGSNNYTFPECSFTAPEGGVFSGWTYGTSTRKYNPGKNIWITKNITVTAQWNIPAAAVTIDGTTTYHGTLELAAAAVEGKTATVKLLDNVKLPEHLTFKAKNLTLDLNGKTISDYYLTLCNTVSITGPGILEGYGMWLDIDQYATVTINEGVAIIKDDSALAIQMKYGSKLILNGGSVALRDTTPATISGQAYYGQNGPIVVVNADGVTNRFGNLNVYFNITPTTKPSMPVLADGIFYYKIDNQITGATLGETVTYDGNTYAMEGANVTVSKDGLAACYYNGAAATQNEGGTFTFTMPAAVATIKDVPDHNHMWEYKAEGSTITATCTSTVGNCPTPNGGTVTISASNSTYAGTAKAATAAETGWIADSVTVQYQKQTESGTWGTATTTAPTDAGIYKASITLGSTSISAEYEIKSKTLTISYVTPTTSRAYEKDDQTVAVTGVTVDGKVGSDHVSVTIPSDFKGTLSSDAVGTYDKITIDVTKLTLSGVDAGNYQLPASGENLATNVSITGTIAETDVSGIETSYAYTGEAIQPVPVVTVNGVTLAKGTDYEVSYGSNTNAAENGTVTITGKGLYAGAEVTKNFDITPVTITSDHIELTPESAEFTGNKHTTAVKVTVNGKVLAAGTDYTVTGNTDIGPAINDYTITVTGKDNYAGTAAKTYKITAKQLKETDVTVTADLTYTGMAQEPTIEVKNGGTVLTKGTDYTVTYEKVNEDNTASAISGAPTDAGTYNVVITGSGTYGGTVKKSFQIKPLASITADPEKLEAVTYTGEEIKPAVTVKGVQDKELVKDTDYTISYTNNVNKGTATVTITGKGNYAGASATKTFTIKAKELTDANVSIEETVLAYREGQTTVPEITVTDGSRALAEGTDYVVGYLDKDGNTVEQPSAIGTYTVQVIGIASLSKDGSGNYSGTVSKTFVITDDVTAPEITGVTNGKTYYTTQKVTAKDDNLTSVLVNSNTILPDDGVTEISVNLTGNQAKTYTVTAKDIANNETSVTVTMKPISTLDDTIEILTVENVKLTDKDTIQAVLDVVTPIRKNECGNATQAEKDALDAIISKCNDLLGVIGAVEDVIDQIRKLPDPSTIQPYDETVIDAYEKAQDAYDKLSDHGKELVGEENKAKLDAVRTALTAYKITKGHKSKFVKGSYKTLSFTANGSVSKFSYIEVDGKQVDAKYYTVASDSGTVITLKASYLQSLKTGKHYIQVNYTDGNTGGEEYFRVTVNNGNPFTGDDPNMLLFGGVAMTSLLCMAMMVMFYLRKKGKYQR